MQEHERKDYERLRAEGRWPQASEFREAERKRLRKAGRNRQQACDESWSLMVAKYPSLSQINRLPPDVGAELLEGVMIEHSDDERRELIELAQDPDAWDDSLELALSWGNAFGRFDVTPKQAPSVLSWLMLKLARADEDLFKEVCFLEFCKRNGERWPPNAKYDASLRYELSSELSYDECLAALDDEDRKLGRFPSLIDRMNAAGSPTEADEIYERALEESAASFAEDQRSPASSASKS